MACQMDLHDFPSTHQLQNVSLCNRFSQLCWEISTPTRLQNLHKQILLLLHFFFAPTLQTKLTGIYLYLAADVLLFMTQ